MYVILAAFNAIAISACVAVALKFKK
jgi:hypothetical protein